MCISREEGLRQRRATKTISLDEVALHSTVDDCWLAIKGRVYDVSGFGYEHPGGKIIYTAAGMDATHVFSAFHPASTFTLLEKFYIGDLAPEHRQSSEYENDVLNMRMELHRLHAFDSSKRFYVRKLLTNLALFAAGAALTMSYPTNIFALALGGFLVALGLQQCGWLAHDFCHNQVFKDRMHNAMVGLLTGNILQGFSVAWWKNKHNHHHAATNVTHTAAGGDPDIDTFPILLWSEKLIEGEDLDTVPLFLVKNQTILYFPILCFARLSWLVQSFNYLSRPSIRFGGHVFKALEVITLFIHHGLMLALVSTIPSWPLRILYSIWVQSLGGLLIGIVFTVGHNAMEVLTEEQMKETDFVKQQLITTRNVTPSMFSDFFTGGLNYQVEHHIWPRLPRHHLPKAASILKEFCNKHGLPYHCKGIVEGNVEVCALINKLQME